MVFNISIYSWKPMPIKMSKIPFIIVSATIDISSKIRKILIENCVPVDFRLADFSFPGNIAQRLESFIQLFNTDLT